MAKLGREGPYYSRLVGLGGPHSTPADAIREIGWRKDDSSLILRIQKYSMDIRT